MTCKHSNGITDEIITIGSFEFRLVDVKESCPHNCLNVYDEMCDGCKEREEG